MTPLTHSRALPPLRTLVRLLAGLALTGLLQAFPPAPHHEVYGLVRDERGNPLNQAKASVFLELGGSVIAAGAIRIEAGVDGNYRLAIPLDSGLTAQRYRPTALLPQVPFRLRVRIGNVTYLPIQLSGAGDLLTRPGARTRVDLTLGEDADGDGLPDAWERALLAARGGRGTLADVRPGGDDDGDGMSNLQEYLAGTYAFDPQDGFALTLLRVVEGRSELEFTAIRGRTYSLLASTDLTDWEPVSFRVGEGPDQDSYLSSDVRPVRVTVGPAGEGESAPRFFKVMVH